MKKELLLAVALLGVSAYAMKNGVEAQYQLAFAESGNTNIVVDCNEQTVTAITPNEIKYTIAWPTSPSATVESKTATGVAVSYTNAVDSDTVTSATLIDSSAAGGSVSFYQSLPHMRLSNLQCRNLDMASLEAHNEGTDGEDLTIGVSASAFSSDPTGTQIIDDNLTGSKAPLFKATTGLIGAAAINDSGDRDGTLDGQVKFGGTSATSGGGYMATKVNTVVGYDLTSTVSELLQFTFTAEPD